MSHLPLHIPESTRGNITVMHKYLSKTLSKSDSNLFPNLLENDLVCSLLPSDTTKYNGRNIATLTTPIMVHFNDWFKATLSMAQTIAHVNNFKSPKTINKPKLCFLILVLKTVYYDNKPLYNQLYPNVETLPDTVNILLNQLVKCIWDEVTFEDLLQLFADKVDMSTVSTISNDLKKLLDQLCNDKERHKVKIADLFTIKDSQTNIMYRSILMLTVQDITVIKSQEDNGALYQKLKIALKYLHHLKSVSFNLLNEMSTIGLEIHISKIREQYLHNNPLQCIKVNHDPPEMDPGMIDFITLFKDYTLAQLDDFINIDGKCFSIAYIATNLISNDGVFLVNNEMISIPKKKQYEYLALSIANYYSLETNESEMDDLINLLKTKKEMLSYCKQYRHLQTFEKMSSSNLKWLMDVLISGKYKTATDKDQILKLYNETSNTIFELIGLMGYTFMSDMIFQKASDGDYFQISTICIDKFNKVLRKLNETTAKSLSSIQFGSISIESIKNSLSNTCIHGIGINCMTFYLRCYDAFINNINNLGPSNAALSPYPAGIEDIASYFPLLSFFIKTPNKVSHKTSIKYLVCFPQDADVYNNLQANPFETNYLVSGFDDKFEFHHLFYIDDQSHDFKVVDGLPHQLLLPDSVTQFIDIRAYNSTIADTYKPLLQYFSEYPKHLLPLMRAANTFGKNRIQRFSVFADFTSSMCQLMIPPQNSNTNNSALKKLQEFIATHEYFDLIELENRKHIPKYTVIIQTRQPRNARNALVMTKDFVPPNVSGNNHNYYITDLLSLIQLQFSTVKLNEITVARVVTPNNRQDITDIWHYYRLIGDLYSPMNPTSILSPLSELFPSFEQYVVAVSHQPLQITTVFDKLQEKTIQFHNAHNKTLSSDSAEKTKKQIMKIILLMYAGFFMVIAPSINLYFKNTNDVTRLYSIDQILDIDKNTNLEKMYEDFLYDFILQVCGEGMFLSTATYNFTDIGDIYFLQDLHKKFIAKNGPSITLQDSSIKNMIEVLNESISIYSGNLALVNNDNKNSGLYTHEALRIAVEYLTKLDVISEHETRINMLIRDWENNVLHVANRPNLNIEITKLTELLAPPSSGSRITIGSRITGLIKYFEGIQTARLPPQQPVRQTGASHPIRNRRR